MYEREYNELRASQLSELSALRMRQIKELWEVDRLIGTPTPLREVPTRNRTEPIMELEVPIPATSRGQPKASRNESGQSKVEKSPQLWTAVWDSVLNVQCQRIPRHFCEIKITGQDDVKPVLLVSVIRSYIDVSMFVLLGHHH